MKTGDVIIGDTRESLRVLETGSAPTFYLPPDDIETKVLHPESGESWCEWKGRATYWSLVLPDRIIERVAWSYGKAWPGYEAIRDHIAFYPTRIDCSVDGERAQGQPGDFYGGWVTADIVGPIKGDKGTSGW